MNSFVAVFCLAVLAVANAGTKYDIMDSQTELVKGGKCDDSCSGRMKGGLAAISGVFNTILTKLSFKNKFCNVTVQELGNFEPEHECFANEDNTIHDHKIRITFKKSNAILMCLLSNNPTAAAEKVNSADMPTGKQCGAEDKLEKQAIVCDADEGSKADNPIEVFADLNNMAMDLVFRVDATNGEKVYPLSASFDLEKKNPATLKKGEGFEKSWECLFNDKNIKIIIRNLFGNAFKTVFDCLDEQNEQPNSIIGPILFTAGNCKTA